MMGPTPGNDFMPNVICPGCQTLLSLDPTQGFEFECPTCNKTLRLKRPPNAAAPKPMTAATIPVREPVDDYPPPVRRKKKKRYRGPSGEVSVLLVPLGGLAVLLLLASSLVRLHLAAKEQRVEPGIFAYAVTLIAAFISLAIGGIVTRLAVNSFSRKKRVPELEFAEAVCLYPLVAFPGVIGAVLLTIGAFSFFSDGVAGPKQDQQNNVKIFVGVATAVLGFVAAGTPTVKFLLNTRWSDAGSICVRFLLVFFLTLVVLNVLLGLLIVALKG
jgi:hypothetical protein